MPSPFSQRCANSYWFIYPIFALVALGYMLACGLDYGDPVKYRTSFTETPVVRQGQDLRVHYAFDRLRICELTRVRIVIDGGSRWHEISRDSMPASGGVTTPDKPEEVDVKISITRDMDPGLAAYRAILSYECPLHLGPITVPNWFQQYTPKVVIAPDVQFRIAPAR